MNDYYVYCIFDEAGVPRYVGASAGRKYNDRVRCWKLPSNWEYNRPVCRWLKKIGGPPGIRKVLTGLSHQDAKYWVKNLIARFGRLCDRSGPLLNLSDGSCIRPR